MSDDPFTILGLPIVGAPPPDSVPLAIVVIIEVLDTNGEPGLYIGNSEMSAWANTGLLVAATDRARTHMQSGWVQDGNDD